MSDLSAHGNIKSQCCLAVMYAFGNQAIKTDVSKVKKILTAVLTSSHREAQGMYSFAIALLGYLHEANGQLNEAIKMYKKYVKQGGKYHLARLILSEKLPGDYIEARNLLEKGHLTHETLTLFYGTVLMAEGEAEKEMAISKINLNKSLFHVVMELQYAIAYKYGFGFVQSDEMAALYCDKITDIPDEPEAVMFCLGFIEVLGLRGEANLEKGFALID